MPMKVYHWPEVEALADWDNGQVIVVADSLEVAIELACKSAEYSQRLHEEIRDELTRKSPIVIDKFPWAVLIEGSS